MQRSSVLGCSTPVKYVPQPNLTPEEAKHTILRAFEEQPAKFAPDRVEVTDEKISLWADATKRSGLVGGVTTVTSTTTVYFESHGVAQVERRSKLQLEPLHGSRYAV